MLLECGVPQTIVFYKVFGMRRAQNHCVYKVLGMLCVQNNYCL